MGRTFTRAFAAVLSLPLVACSGHDDGVDVGRSDNQEVFADWSGELDERRLELIDVLERLSVEAGLHYRFDLFSPDAEDLGETVRLSFVYEGNVSGGSPVAVIEKAGGAFLQIDFTQ